eukprot:TRINITY_DN123937_c0_g1_i1.p1 TRINITY_DN123937_c0_g1~~TRINITY_DN123937_c0_g1_i1.p1  ORF type:complete len:297 (-),score=43.99 TRINITY_DN123937_c0_g1_i1:184-1074(-)
MKSSIVGVVLALLGTLSGTAGKQLIRFSESRKSKWLLSLGILVNTLPGPILEVVSLSFAPQSMIAPFGGFDIVWNVLIAPFTLGEKLTGRRLVSVVLIFLGSFLSVVLTTPEKAGEDFTLEVLQALLLRGRTAAYLVCFGLWYGLNIYGLMPQSKGSVTRGFSLGATAGSLAGNVFCLKALVELIKVTVETRSFDAWTNWLSYAVLAGALFFAISNIAYMTKGLQEYEAIFMVTIFKGAMLISNAASALVVLGERDEEPFEKLALYLFCIALVIVGMYVGVSSEAGFGKAEEEKAD